MAKNRFRIDPGSTAGTCKKLSRVEIVSAPEGNDMRGFLGKLAALFGAPRPVDGGFSYALYDTERAIAFTAYSGPSGPSYGAALDLARAELEPTVRALEALLATTDPVDCALEVTEEVDYGGTEVKVGLRGGAPFREPRSKGKKRPAVNRVKTYEDCLAVAKARGGSYGTLAGFQKCIDAALPTVPDSFVVGDRRYENCIGFVFGEKSGRPVYVFDEGGGLEELAVESIPFTKPLSPAAALWLESYATWRKKRARA